MEAFLVRYSDRTGFHDSLCARLCKWNGVQRHTMGWQMGLDRLDYDYGWRLNWSNSSNIHSDVSFVTSSLKDKMINSIIENESPLEVILEDFLITNKKMKNLN